MWPLAPQLIGFSLSVPKHEPCQRAITEARRAALLALWRNQLNPTHPPDSDSPVLVSF
jgi:hypothetical protein